MSTFPYTGRRLAAMVAATVIGGAGLVVADGDDLHTGSSASATVNVTR
ncbi:hypothetical protein J7E88_06840 [Streptomyces sp. ISL-10]|nr:hypothetical protein [Streptomyces sp. ISL-10]MBT2365040.1 hypothetical protein [Streptomyces sp. ISL-10]